MSKTATETVDDQRRSKMVELRAELNEIDAALMELAEKEVLDPAEEERWIDLNTQRDAIYPEYKKMEERALRIEEIKANKTAEIRGMPEAMRTRDLELRHVDLRSLDVRSAREGALRTIGDDEQGYILSDNQRSRLEKMCRTDTSIARRVLATENDDYRSAFMKMTQDPNGSAMLTDDERVALRRAAEFRAQDEGATTHGGFAVPVFIDPTVILTDQETDNPFLRLARIENVTTNAWKGVSAAGVSWSFDSEAAEVSDDSITIAQPSVTVFMARGFIPYSIEVGDDWPGFQAEMGRLLGAGYDELLIDKFSRGTGTGEPRGLLVALTATAGSCVTPTTDGGFGQEDVYKAWKALPQKYRRSASWMMSVDVMNRVRQFGAANVYHAYTVSLPEGAVEQLFSRPVYENAYFPDFIGTTGGANILAVGDFSNYVIARRTGMNVELIPNLIGNSNRPTGQRGWFAYARIGGNSVNDAGFRLLQNT